MCRGRRGGGRVRGEQPVGLIHGVGGVSLRVRVDATTCGWIGRVRPLRGTVAIRIPFRLSAHPKSELNMIVPY